MYFGKSLIYFLKLPPGEGKKQTYENIFLNAGGVGAWGFIMVVWM